MISAIRRGIFETNSSSVHTISISKAGFECPKLDIRRRKKEDGTFGRFVIGKLGMFGKDSNNYKTQDEKLSYLLTLCYILDGHQDLEDTMECYAFKDLEEKVIEYCKKYGVKCDGIRIDPSTEDEAGIDHQTLCDYDGLYDFEYMHMSFIDFIFNSFISLTTDCD